MLYLGDILKEILYFIKDVLCIYEDKYDKLGNIFIYSVEFFNNKSEMVINISDFSVSLKDMLADLENFIKRKFNLKSVKIVGKEIEDKIEKSEIIKEIEIRKDDYLFPKPIFETACPIFGNKITGKPVNINKVEKSTNIIIWGKVFDVSVSSNRFDCFCYVRITDYTSSISLKLNKRDSDKSLFDSFKNIKKDQCILVSGRAYFDDFEKEIVVLPKDISIIEMVKVVDKSEKRRAELHAHTLMSAMDGMNSAEDLIKRALEFGHNAIAITDHGVVQSFPDMMNVSKKVKSTNPNFKIIYGMESYFVDDSDDFNSSINEIDVDSSYVCFDLETTGLSASTERIIEIGAVKILNGKLSEEFCTFVNPGKRIPKKLVELTGISDDMVRDAPDESEAISKFIEYCGDCDILVAHNAPFDVSFLKAAIERCNIAFNFKSIDTVPLCRSKIKVIKNYKLSTVSKYFNLPDFTHHRACDDARTLALIFLKLIESSNVNDVKNLGDIFSS